MKITIIQTITNVLDENKHLKSSSTVESYILEADLNKVIREISTKKILGKRYCETKKSRLSNYEEIDSLD